MRVTVHFYAVLKDLTGCSTDEVDIPEGSDAAGLLKTVCDRHAGIRPYATVIRLATETEYIKLDQSIEPGADIAFIPPVSGG